MKAMRPRSVFLLFAFFAAAACGEGDGKGRDGDADADAPDLAFDDGAADADGEDREAIPDIADLPDAESPGDGTGDDPVEDEVGDTPGEEIPPSCTLTDSGPVEASSDGQVFELLRVTSTSGPAVTVNGFSNVVIRNCEIRHAGGSGIRFGNAAGIRIENISVIHDGAPAAGQNPSDGLNNIEGEFSSGVVITGVRLEKGSSGIYLLQCPGASLSFVEGHDFRGPFPRGQVVQFNHCDGAVLEDFSSECPAATSWTEDNVSVYQSSNVTVRRGLVDGNNSPSGVGVMFELSGGGSSGGLVEDVDAVRQGNGCFSGYPAFDVVFRRTRSRDNICSDQGRGAPLSGGLAWAGSPESSNLMIEDSSYFNLCAGLVWLEDVFTAVDLSEEDFTLREPQRLSFCWL